MSYLGRSLDRIEGPLKVTGAARYAAEFSYPNLHYAAIASAQIAAGEIAAIDTAQAQSDPDVIAIFDHRNAPRMQSVPIFPIGPAGESTMPLQDATIRYAGQPVALVVARTPEAARHAAAQVHVTYHPATPRVMDQLLASGEPWEDASARLQHANDATRGDFDAELQRSEVVQQAVFSTPAHSPNAMELGATVALFDGDVLVLHDSTQWVLGTRNAVARALQLPLDRVRVDAPYVGGGFGSKCFTWSHTLLAAAAAWQLHLPVQLVLTRAQAHQAFGLRPQTWQRLTLAADRDGTLRGIRHHSVAQTSMSDTFLRSASEVSEVLYACPALETRNKMMRVHACTPSNMRAPAESYGSFALESTMDELAERLHMDPLILRQRNLPAQHPDGVPWSSCNLALCYEQGASRFGWANRPLAPGTLRDGKERIGWGMAAGAYGCYRSQAAVQITLRQGNQLELRCATQEIGTGTRTLMAQVAAEVLGIPPGQIMVFVGHTDLPTAPVHGASRTAATVGPAVLLTAKALLADLIQRAIHDPNSQLNGCPPELLLAREGYLQHRDQQTRRESFSAILERAQLPELTAQRRAGPPELNEEDWRKLQTGINTIRTPRTEHFAMYSFCAHFVEVRVQPELGSLRVSRVVTRAAAGRILNPKQAHSQLMGSAIFGLGMALTEQVRFHPRNGRMLSASPTEYEIPFFAMMPNLDLAFVEETDTEVNELGVKGIGEVGLVGFAAAVANAFWHATGERVRSLPITTRNLVELSGRLS